jgi:hypothetical protein
MINVVLEELENFNGVGPGGKEKDQGLHRLLPMSGE